MNRVKEHEHVILSAVLAYNPDGIDALISLFLSNYRFCDEYKEIAEYLFNASKNLDATVNIVDFKDKFNLTPEQVDYWLHTGTQEVRPSREFLLKNKYLEDKKSELFTMAGKVKQGEVTEDDFKAFEARLAAIQPLRHIQTQEEIDDEIQAASQRLHEKRDTVFNLGINQLDKLIMGIDNETILVVGGFSGSGKTNLATQFSLAVLGQNGRVSYMSSENSPRQMKLRFGSHQAQVMQASFKKPHTEEHTRLLEGVNEVTELYGDNLILSKITDFDEALKLMKLQSMTDQADVFVLDYLQLFQTSRKGLYEERIRLDDFCSKLVEFSTDFHKAVIVVSQTVEGATISFKGSQSIRNMATDAIIIFKSSEAEYETHPINPTKKIRKFRAVLDTIKSRNGIPGKAYCEVKPSDPAFRDVSVNFTDKTAMEAWQAVTQQQKARATW